MKKEKLEKFTLFIGLNDKDSKQQEINTVDCYKILMNLFLKNGVDCTISESQGFYTHLDGTFTIEKSLRVEILFSSKEKIYSLCDSIKILLNQESIAVQRDLVESELY